MGVDACGMVSLFPNIPCRVPAGANSASLCHGKMASAVPSRFWEYFWGYAEEADLLELMRFLCDTMVPLLCPRREQWLACNEALRARSERRRPRNRDKRMMDTEAAGMQAALIATGIIIVPRASALSSHAMKDLPPTRYSAAPGYLFLW